MLNIDVLTLGNEFKNDNGETYKISSNFGEGDKIFVELTKIKPPVEDELLSEI